MSNNSTKFVTIAATATIATLTAVTPALAGLADDLRGYKIYLRGGGSVEYWCDGKYRYTSTYGTAAGTYRTSGDKVYVTFDNGNQRTDTILPDNQLRNSVGDVYSFTRQSLGC